ncbi:hypothetical protein ID866_8518 [Astraeus odoratus]|nr:hypothetical protein ID866_8518 [Astraeus odoratus]
MRVRKTVTEGYRSPPSTSNTPHASPMKAATSSTSASDSTHSANDTLRQVFASTSPSAGGYTPQSSPSKRRRPQVEPESDDETLDLSLVVGHSEDWDEMTEDISYNERMEVDRLIKPLRRAGRSTTAGASPPRPQLVGMTDINASQHVDTSVSNNAGRGQDVSFEMTLESAQQ